MTRIITARPLTRENFAAFGDVLDTATANHYPINNGKCERYHDLATAEATGPNARVILSIFKGTPYDFPLKLAMVERHPYRQSGVYALVAASVPRRRLPRHCRTARVSRTPFSPNRAKA